MNEELIQEEEFIDVKAIILRFVKYFRKTWVILLILGVIGAGAGYGYARMSKYTEYSASATYTVEKSTSVVTNASLTARLAEGIYTISRTTDFREQINEILEVEVSGYTISASEVTDANIMTVYVTSGDMNLTNNIIEIFDQVYSPWATNLIGNCTITKVDEALCYGPEVYGQSTKKMLILGFAAGTVIWCVLAALYLIMENTILDVSQMDKVTLSTCMGFIPEIKKKKREKSTREPLLMSTRNIDPDYLQAIRRMRHRMEKRMEGKKVLLITSSLPAEGKSLITMNLAYDLIRRGKKVVVIDADLRHHGISELLQIKETGASGDDETGKNAENSKTLLDYLTEKDPLPEDMITALPEYDGISVLFGSWNTAADTDYLDMERFGEIIEALRKQAEYILIDTPPVGIRGDAILFSEAVDAVWYVVRYNFAGASEIRRGMEPFYRNEKLDGYIMNCTPLGENEDHYGGLRRYGYGYGYGYVYSNSNKNGYGNKKKGSKGQGDTQIDDNMLDW